MIETTRTVLRNFQKDDLSALHDYAKLVGVGEGAGWKHHESLDETTAMLETFIVNKRAYAIVSKKEQKLIGHISVHPDSEGGKDDTKELGFVLHPNYHNQGIMTEVIQAILDNLFSQDISYVYACCFQNNSASKRVIEKSGFLFEQEGEFFSQSLAQVFSSYEYVYTRKRWVEGDVQPLDDKKES